MNDLLIIDFEMCEVDRAVIKNTGVYLDHEIIQIGAVILNEKNKITAEYSAYVKPHYGRVTENITALTGIIDLDLERAPELEEALKKFAAWIGKNEVTASSWSDTDQIQLSVEMEQKKIKNRTIEDLLEGWVDLQQSYGKLTGANKSVALFKALRAEGVLPEGREHDGAADAKNTALLIAKLRKEGKELELESIDQCVEYIDTEDTGGSVFGNLFAGLNL